MDMHTALSALRDMALATTPDEIASARACAVDVLSSAGWDKSANKVLAMSEPTHTNASDSLTGLGEDEREDDDTQDTCPEHRQPIERCPARCWKEY